MLPAYIAAACASRGPRFGDRVWDVRPFVPRSTRLTRVDFGLIGDPWQERTVREFLYSRINHASPVGRSRTARPMKLTRLQREFWLARTVLRDLAAAGAPRLADAERRHLDQVLAGWKQSGSAAERAGTLKHLAAHGPFLTDALAITPWPGRTAAQVTGDPRSGENSTLRIPEHITAPLIQAAVFYVTTAAGDIIAARAEVAALRHAREAAPVKTRGQARAAVEALIAQRRAAGRGVPAVPARSAHNHRGAPVADGIIQAPNEKFIALLAGLRWTTRKHRDLLAAAAAELGYEAGGLDTPMSPWPVTGRPWRPGMDPAAVHTETSYLRTACWIVIAYLSGMRDAEVRELGRDCAFTEPGADGRDRFKLRGRVFKERRLSGDEAEWVVLDAVHHAVNVLLQINDDPTHLFGYTSGPGVTRARLIGKMPERISEFAAHANVLFSGPGELFIPGQPGGDGGNAGEAAPWAFTTPQFRRTVAWHIAHQPFGIIAGARQYQHAETAMFEGYAGTSSSGFAAEVAAEQATARLDYAEELYRDWDTQGPSGGGAAKTINTEFARIRSELADLPGTAAGPARLRTMLTHLATTLHPGVLGDCFYRPGQALCADRAQPAGEPLPMLNTCLHCPNARRSGKHLPRLQQARDQARDALTAAGRRALPPLQKAALDGHLNQLDQLITQITHAVPAAPENPDSNRTPSR